MHSTVWRKANTRLIPCAVLFIGGAIVSDIYGNLRSGDIDRKLIALAGILTFLVFSTTFLHILTSVLRKLIASHRLGSGRAASTQFILRTFGYLAILLMTLQLCGIPVGKLLLGSAVLGIILGVAAQQALANFFASFVLIVSHPFTVGQQVIIKSGALGGEYVGTVVDLGMTHTRLRLEDDSLVLLPNSTILSGATIMLKKQAPPNEKKADS